MLGRSRPSRSIGSPGLSRRSPTAKASCWRPTPIEPPRAYDALNRIKQLQLPQDVEGKRRELRPVYNNAGGLEKVFLDDTLYVERIAYDAKGQRALIAYGNGVMTRYAYDPHTFRLKRLRSERYYQTRRAHLPPGRRGPAGLWLRLRSCRQYPCAFATGRRAAAFLNNPRSRRCRTIRCSRNCWRAATRSTAASTYDPIYRLLSATGRECDRPPRGAVGGSAALHRPHQGARLYGDLSLRRRWATCCASSTATARTVSPAISRWRPPTTACAAWRSAPIAMITPLIPTAICCRRRPPAISNGTIATR